MTISLPLMNNLCKRWTLPTHIQKDCDLYFLRNFSDAEFVQVLKPSSDGNDLLIQEYGVNFIVIFQHGADKVYTKNGELAKRNEPNNTNYWCSFRSITFNWQGVACTKSYVLVQVDKGVKDFRDLKEEKLARAGAVGAPREPFHRNQQLETYKELAKSWNTFAERSQPDETLKDSEED
ncbi:hypothetical protein D9M71_286250 [compost metagenome]